MVKKEENKIYCSLDIETTGFDPLKEEILEVGFAFFEVGNKGIKINEEWTQVFKPSKEVSPQILGLTGISKEEIENAPAFADHRDFIQEKLGNAVIVGHNINFDIKFLEGFGIKFSGQSIDTLDLVQWLLPTHHSYNLENLMHTFGISHKEAHRALADSKATLVLLEKLLKVFCALPGTLKEKIKKIIKPCDFIWAEFLNCELDGLSFKEAVSKVDKKKTVPEKAGQFEFEDKSFNNFSLNSNYITQIASTVFKDKVLLVVPKIQTVLELLKNGYCDAAALLPEQQFDEKKFNALTKKKDLSPETIRFILKIFVWQETNWQNQTLVDLNLSFFGGQFKSLVCGGKILEKPAAKKVVCDMATFLYLSEKAYYTKRKAIICGLNEFETSVTSNISTKASWGFINFLLKGLFNSEFGTGNEKFKEPVANLLLASDLFFGLVSALLKNENETFQYFKITPALENDERWNKITMAAESFCKKLGVENKILTSSEIARFSETLKSFFTIEQNRVKWIELADKRCVFSSMPLDISELVKNALGKFFKVCFADALDTTVLPKFFLQRLGLKDFRILPEKSLQKTNKSIQGDLFSGLKKMLGKKKTISFHYWETVPMEQDILKILQAAKPWPAAVLLPNPQQVKDFYEHNYENLKQEVSLLAQTSYGGSNKIFRNFSINKNSLMLVSDKFILKSLTGASAVEQVNRLSVKTLVICRLPFEQFTHPYQEAVSATLPNSFEDYALPKALYNLHCLLKFFYSEELENVYIVDSKLSKPYAKVFKDYWQVIPNSQKVD